MNALQKYLSEIKSIITKVEKTQADAMESAAEAIADTLLCDGMIYTFGTGHSHLLAEEIFYRAGGLVRVCPIEDAPLMLHVSASRSSEMERMQGYAELLLIDHRSISAGDVMLLFSNSGRNTMVIEMAEAAKKRGMKTICITNMIHSRSVMSRHPSGKKLYEVCDVVIDNCGCMGDACIELGNSSCGPTSTAIGAAILQAIVCSAVEKCNEKGIAPEVFLSGNIDGGDEHNRKYIEKYSPLIKSL